MLLKVAMGLLEWRCFWEGRAAETAELTAGREMLPNERCCRTRAEQADRRIGLTNQNKQSELSFEERDILKRRWCFDGSAGTAAGFGTAAGAVVVQGRRWWRDGSDARMAGCKDGGGTRTAGGGVRIAAVPERWRC